MSVNTNGSINTDGSIIMTTTQHLTVEDVLTLVEQKYEGLLKPQAKLEHDRYGSRGGFHIYNSLYEDEVRDGNTGVLWVKANMVWVPYNRELMIEYIKATMKKVAEEGSFSSKYNTLQEHIAYNAVNNYRSSTYYTETYLKLADECVKEMNERFGVPETIKKAQLADLRAKELRDALDSAVEYFMRDAELNNLPKSTPVSVKNTIADLRSRLVEMINKYDHYEERYNKRNAY